MQLLERRRITHRSEETERWKDTSRKVLVGLPYINGLSEELRRTFRAHGVDSFFKPSNTLHQLLCSPKDPAKKVTSRVIYQIGCEVIGKDSGCRSIYIKETGRKLKARFAEHRRSSIRTLEISHQHL